MIYRVLNVSILRQIHQAEDRLHRAHRAMGQQAAQVLAEALLTRTHQADHSHPLLAHAEVMNAAWAETATAKACS